MRKEIIEGEMDKQVGNVSTKKVPGRCVQQQLRTSAIVQMKNHHAD